MIEAKEEGGSLELATSLERALSRRLSMPVLLQAAASDRPNDDVRRELLPLGLLETALPKEIDGLDMDLRSIAEIWRVAGRHLLPTAIREEALVVAPLLAAAAAAGDGSAAAYLRDLRSGAVRGASRVFRDELPADGRVHVWSAGRPDVLALVGAGGGALFERPEVESAHAIDLGQGLATFDVGSSRPFALAGEAIARRVRIRWQVAVLAEIVGSAERVCELSTAYAQTRQQFGRAIAQFQAVAHMLADMRMSVDAGSALVSRIVGGLDEPELDFLLEIGRYALPQAARSACELAIQVHGGIGFTWESGLHLFYRRVLQLQAALGGAHGTATDVGRRYLRLLRGGRVA